MATWRWLFSRISTDTRLALKIVSLCCRTSHWHTFTRFVVSLPLSLPSQNHWSQRVNQLAVIALGGAIGFFTGDPLRLLEDAQILKPNFFPSVPRVLNRIYQTAMVAGNVPGLKGALFRRAVRTKLDNLHSTGAVTHPLWDRLVFRKVRWC